MEVSATLQTLSEQLPLAAGPLGLLSGDEFLPPVRAFDERLLELTGPRVGVVYCADHRAQAHSERFARRHFETLHVQPTTLDMHADAMPDVDLVYLAGGSPKDLLEHLRASVLWPQVLERWKSGIGLAGSSAGAMVLCRRLLTPREGARVPTVWAEGVGPLDGIGLAVHASSRSKEWLEEISRGAPVRVLALGDHTGIVLRRGHEPEVIGENGVWQL
jgi:hypothetical protein